MTKIVEVSICMALSLTLGACSGTTTNTSAPMPDSGARDAPVVRSSSKPPSNVRTKVEKITSSTPTPKIDEEPLVSPPPRPANSKGRVLFLGDSFAIGAFGRTFDQSLRDAGFEVYTSVSGGGSPYYWLSAYPPVSIDIAYWERTPTSQRRLGSISAVPKIEKLMEKWDPDIVVVQTGTNLYSTLRSSRRTKEGNIKEISSLTTKMCRAITNGGAKCYWITPPSASTGKYPQALQDEMLQITRNNVQPYGKVFNSYAVTEFPESSNSDGIHLGPTEARAWASKAAANFIATY